jgi:hypothetical protein
MINDQSTGTIANQKKVALLTLLASLQMLLSWTHNKYNHAHPILMFVSKKSNQTGTHYRRSVGRAYVSLRLYVRDIVGI